jgi:hypothetical protein
MAATVSPPNKSTLAIEKFDPIIPKNTSELLVLAQVFYAAGLHSRGITRPEGVAAVIAYGLELGIRPATALNSIYVQNGTARIWGTLPLGLVLASGLMEGTPKEWFSGEGDERTAHCVIKRRGDEQGAVEFTYSLGQAKHAGLLGKAESKGKKMPWDNDSDLMLKYRARGRGLNDKFADVLNGLTIAELERDDEPETTGTSHAGGDAAKQSGGASGSGSSSVVVTGVRTDAPGSSPAPQGGKLGSSGEPVTGTTPALSDKLTDSQLHDIRRLMPDWCRRNFVDPDTNKDAALAAWQAFLKVSYGVVKAAELTVAQATDLLSILLPISNAADPAAKVFDSAAKVEAAGNAGESVAPAVEQSAPDAATVTTSTPDPTPAGGTTA